MLLIGYAIVGLIVIGWYKLILCKDLCQNHILRRSVKLLIYNRKVIFKNIFFIGEVDEKQQEEFDYIKNKLLDIFIMIINVVGWWVLCPIIIEYILKESDDSLVKYIIFVFMICGLIVMKLKEVTQRCVNLINEYIKGILWPIEHNPQLIQKDESKRIRVKWTSKKIIEFLVYVCINLIILWGFYFAYSKYKDSKIMGGISIVVLFGIVIFDRRKSKTSVKQKENRIEIDESTFGGIESDVVNMCKKLGILNIKISTSEDNNIKIGTTIDEDGTPHIGVSYRFVQILYSENSAKDILLYTIGHELAHIYYNDFRYIRRRIKMSCIAYFISLFIILMLFTKMYLIQYLLDH